MFFRTPARDASEEIDGSMVRALHAFGKQLHCTCFRTP